MGAQHGFARASLLSCALLLLIHRASGAIPATAAALKQSTQATLKLITLNGTGVDPLALCNDGSPGGYYWAPASWSYKAETEVGGAQNNIWIIYLEGGLWCWDSVSCLARQQTTPFFVSSQKWPAFQALGGIFDTDIRRSPVANANKVYASYCSSDAWMGDIGAADVDPTLGPNWHFRGQRLIRAIIADLVSNQGMGTHGPGEKLLFGGCSAGARGAMANLDTVAAYVESLTSGDLEVYGFLDSPLWVDLEPLESTTISLQYQTAALLEMANATAVLGEACEMIYPVSSSSAWKCLFGQYRIPLLQTKYLLSASQDDRFQLPYNEGKSPPYNGQPQLAYALNFSQSVLTVVEGLPGTGVPEDSVAVYSSACFWHCSSVDDAFWGIHVRGLSLQNYLRMWFLGQGVPATGGVPTHMIESCTGFNCGQCHNKNATKLAKRMNTNPPLPEAPGWMIPPKLTRRDVRKEQRAEKALEKKDHMTLPKPPAAPPPQMTAAQQAKAQALLQKKQLKEQKHLNAVQKHRQENANGATSDVASSETTKKVTSYGLLLMCASVVLLVVLCAAISWMVGTEEGQRAREKMGETRNLLAKKVGLAGNRFSRSATPVHAL